MHLLSQKILLQWTFSSIVVLQSDVSIRTECPRLSDISKHALQRFTQDVGHLVLKVLRRDERVKEVLAIPALVRHNLSTGSAHVGLDIKDFPKMVYGSRAGRCTNVEEHTDIGLKDGSKSVEEPAMGVDLVLALFFETKNELNRDYTILCALNPHRG